MKTGDFVKADPILTGLDGWVEGMVINVKNNLLSLLFKTT